jgi:hypothetical protein
MQVNNLPYAECHPYESIKIFLVQKWPVINNAQDSSVVKPTRRASMKFTASHYGMIIAGITTAYLHISLYSDFGYLDWVVLNGFGTIALLLAYFLPSPYFQQKHSMVFWILFGYIWITISLWVVFGDKTFLFATTAAIGYYAKAAEFLLLACMWPNMPELPQ